MILRFSDSGLGYCYCFQERAIYCGPACGQMLFRFLDWNPLPSQRQLAQEMQTDRFNETLAWWFVAPFSNRNLTMKLEYNLLTSMNESLVIGELKNWISRDYPCALLIGMNVSTDQGPKQVGHYIIVAGYNQSHLYVLDPWPSEKYIRWVPSQELQKAWTFSNCTTLVLYSRPRFSVRIRALDCLGFDLFFAGVVVSNETWSTNASTGFSGAIEFDKLDMGEYDIMVSYLWFRAGQHFHLTKEGYHEVVFGPPVVGILGALVIMCVLSVAALLVWKRITRR